jgi:hypothetical protein
MHLYYDCTNTQKHEYTMETGVDLSNLISAFITFLSFTIDSVTI